MPTWAAQLGRAVVWLRGRPAVAFLAILLTLSWFSTTEGLVTLVKAGVGDVFWVWIPVGVIVFAVTGLMAFFVDQLFNPLRTFDRIVALFFYLLLALFSIAFAFGFWWGLLEAPRQQLETLSAPVERIQRQLRAAEGNLVNVRDSMTRLAAQANKMAVQEEQFGTSCDNNGIRQCLDRCKWRQQQAQAYSAQAEMLDQRIDELGQQLQSITGEESDTQGPAPAATPPAAPDASPATPPAPGADTGTTQVQGITSTTRAQNKRPLNEMPPLERINELDRMRSQVPEHELIEAFDLTEREINGFVDGYEQFRNQSALKNIAAAYKDTEAKHRDGRGKPFSYAGGPVFSCPDETTANLLGQAANFIDGLPKIEEAEIPRPGKATAIYEAIDRLRASALGLIPFLGPKEPPKTVEAQAVERMEQRRDFQNEVDKVEAGIPADGPAPDGGTASANEEEARQQGLRDTDAMPLLIGILVDLLILGVSMFRTRSGGMRRTAHQIEEMRRATATIPVVIKGLGKTIEDEDFKLVKDYQVRHHRTTYFVVPKGRRTQEDQLIGTLCEVLIGEKWVQERPLMWVAPGRQTFTIGELLKSGSERRLNIRERGYSDGGFETFQISEKVTLDMILQFLAESGWKHPAAGTT